MKETLLLSYCCTCVVRGVAGMPSMRSSLWSASREGRIDWTPRRCVDCGGCEGGSGAGGSGAGWACPAAAGGGAGTACRTGTAAATASCSGCNREINVSELIRFN